MASYTIPNAPVLSNINDFRSVIGKDREMAKASRFAVQIGKISSIFSDLIYLCETAEIPGRAFNLQDYRYYGPNIKLPTQSEYTEINFSFYVRDRMKEKELFDKWMAYINPKNTYNFRFRNEYSTDVYIFQYSEIAGASGTRDRVSNPQATYKTILRQAYPINVQAMPLSWAEDNIHRLQVTFTYTDWVTLPETEENSDRMSTITPFNVF